MTDALNRAVTFDTDETGQVVKVTDTANKETRYGYQLGDVATVTDPLGNVSRTFTDGAGQTLRSVDAQGNVDTLTYDEAGRVSGWTDPLGRVTGYEYDPNGNLHRVTDARNHTTVYDWDTSDRLERVTDPLDRKTAYTYDGNGNLATATSPAGRLTGYDYDDLDRLRSVRYGVSGSTQESQTAYTYDAGNRLRTIVDSAAGSTTVTPDDFDRPVTVADPNGQVSYTYDAADRRRTMSVPGLPDTAYGYNDTDQLTSVTRGSETAAVGYDPAGRRQSLSLPAGVTQTYGYDDASRLTGVTYKRDTATLGAIAYTVDTLGRTTHVDGSFARVALPAAYGPVSYDAADQPAGSTFDDDGNLTSDGSATYTWNARNELTGYTRAGATVSYGYDGLGRRASRTVAGTRTSYLYDGFNAVQEKAAGTVSASMLSGGLDEVYSRTAGGGSQSLLTDALGSTVATANTSSVGAEYTYDPYGGTTVSGDDLGNPTRFTGREDDGSGLYYYRSRYYSPARQGFLSRDPLGLASGGTNPYTYVNNQPTGLVDPMGTKPNDPPSGRKTGNCTPDPGGGGGDGDWVDPNLINFSQRTISPHDYAQLMLNGAWDWSRPGSALTVIDRGGQLVSYDNRRLDGAREVRGVRPDYKVKVNRVNANDLNPAKTSGMTWDESFEQRMTSKRNRDENGCRVPWQGLFERPTVIKKTPK